MKTNQPAPRIYTHEGAPAKHINAELMLRRSVMSCMLFEGEFYEDGQEISKRIASLVPQVDAVLASEIAVKLRSEGKLRHAPLLIVREMARGPKAHRLLTAETLCSVIQRADELAEFLAIYWKDKKDQPLSAQVKRGLAAAFLKFNEYQLSKYDSADAIKLRDVLFLCHAKPMDDAQADLWKRLVDGKLKPADTWENRLSAGEGKKTEEDKLERWTGLLAEKKLGAMALMRNLRNMQEAGVPEKDVRSALMNIKPERVLPFRFITAARHAPSLEHELEVGMFKCLEGRSKLPGHTVLMVDVSGSMDGPISSKSEVHRVDAACGIAILLREICESVDVVTFSNAVVRVPPRRGFALRDVILQSQPHSGTELGAAVALCARSKETMGAERIIVITDEQAASRVPDPTWKWAWMINVASAKNGVGYGRWNHVDGFSEAVIDFIEQVERLARE